MTPNWGVFFGICLRHTQHIDKFGPLGLAFTGFELSRHLRLADPSEILEVFSFSLVGPAKDV